MRITALLLKLVDGFNIQQKAWLLVISLHSLFLGNEGPTYSLATDQVFKGSMILN